ARSTTEIAVREVLEHRRFGDAVSVALGEVEVTSQVVGYLRKLPSGKVLDQIPLDMPERKLITRSVWYTLSDELLYGSAPGGAGPVFSSRSAGTATNHWTRRVQLSFSTPCSGSSGITAPPNLRRAGAWARAR